MKGYFFVFVLLFLEARGSFFDDFRGALSNINQGIGKLFGDVVTDVKDTIYCTISAVEQVLGINGFLDKRALYNQKCRGRESPQQPSMNSQDSQSRTVSEIRKHSVIHEKRISKVTHESQHSIKTVNKTIINVSGQIDLKNETSRLSEISKMLIQESERLSKRLQEEIKQLQMNRSNKPPAESIWEAVTVLHNLQRNSKNETEINHIRQILEKVTDEMRSKINGQQMPDTDLDKLMKELQNLANNNGKLNSTAENQESELQNLANNTRKLNSTAANQESELQNLANNTGKLNSTAENQDSLSNTKQSNNTSISLKDVNRDEVGRNDTAVKNDENRQIEKSIQPKEPSLSLIGVDSLATFLDSMFANYDDLKHAKRIVSESQQAEKILTNLSKGN